jgi:spore maturation protein CgeB
LKILYIGDVREGTTSLDRMRALQRIGHTLVPFNVPPYQSRHRIISSIQCRLHPRFLLQKLNNDIRSFVKSNPGFDCAWVDKGVWIFKDTVEFLREKCKVAVHYTPDPQILFFRSRHFIQSIPVYDHVVTTKDFELALYAEKGAKNVIHVPQSYCPVRYRNPTPATRFSAEVGFIGRCEPHYLQQINGMNGIEKVVIFGDQWVKPQNRRKVDTTFTVNGSVWKEDYVTALASFKVSLGLLSKNYPEQHTTRTFEIPAAGTFLLAERTSEHLGFFEEGVEAEFFSSPEEMLSKAKFYLANDAARDLIASKGRLRCTRSGYDTDSVMKNILSQAEV